MLENVFQNILNLNDRIKMITNPPNMNRPEQESSQKRFLLKLLEFTKKVSIYKKEKNTIKNLFNEIPAALTTTFCILPYTMARIYISIYFRYSDASIWSLLEGRTFFSNSKTHRIFIHGFLIEELTPRLFQNFKPVMIIVNTHFFKIARTFTNVSLMFILGYGVDISLSEALNISMESLFPKQNNIFSFHQYL
jgi:hypothetical protein